MNITQKRTVSVTQLGKKIEELRIARGLTQGELGKAAGISASRVSEIEREKPNSDLPLETLRAIENALRIEIIPETLWNYGLAQGYIDLNQTIPSRPDPKMEAWQRIRSTFGVAETTSSSVVDELIAERREEAKNE
jgi:transcriptional regulator with XRE-family HTH domain